MRFSKACGKYQKESSPRGRAALLALCALFGACGSSGRAAGKAGPAQEQARESDLRAFCPPAEFADGAYAYKIYGKDGGLSHLAAISDITRDCRFDGGRDSIQLHIAAAGRVVPGPAARSGVTSLPIEVKVMRGAKILFAKTYGQRVSVSRSASQFLLSEWASVKKSEAAKGTKIFIGFAKGDERPKRQKPAAPAAKKERSKTAPPPFAGRLSPRAAPLTIPESF